MSRVEKLEMNNQIHQFPARTLKKLSVLGEKNHFYSCFIFGKVKVLGEMQNLWPFSSIIHTANRSEIQSG